MPETLFHITLLLLWVAWAALLFGGLAQGTPDAERTRRMPRWTRMASSLALVIAAWGFALLHSGSPQAGVAVLTAIGIPHEPVAWHLGPWPHEREWQRAFFAPIDRPVAVDERGWGAKGVLDLARIRSLRDRR